MAPKKTSTMGFARRVGVALASLAVGARAQQCDDSCDSATALCEADVVVDATYYDVCYPTASKKIDANVIGGLKSDGVAVEALADGGRITVVANYMVGCNAGRREASAFAYVAQLYANEFGTGRVQFLSGLKGGSACTTWAAEYRDYAEETFGLDIVDQPYTIYDEDYAIRDLLFTAPYHHPSYVILDGAGEIVHKFVGPCCGLEAFDDCKKSHLLDLNETFATYLAPLLDAQTTRDDGDDEADEEDACETTKWGDWSDCTVACGDSGVRYKDRETCGKVGKRAVKTRAGKG